MLRLATPFLLLVLVATAHAEELRGKVVSIADGDTITVLDADKTKHKIRLSGIDAPESKQAFGTKSKQALSEWVGEKEVFVAWKEKDRNGRLIGTVHLDQRNINLEMVEAGMAWHYKQYSTDKELAAAEEAARKDKRGLWSEKSPEPPWEFRKKARERKKNKKVP